MANCIKETINEIGPQKVFGLITDNAANMKAAWSLIGADENYKHILTYGCAAHGLNLLFSDLTKNIRSFNVLIDKATELVKQVKRSHQISALLKDHSRTSLKLPVKTR